MSNMLVQMYETYTLHLNYIQIYLWKFFLAFIINHATFHPQEVRGKRPFKIWDSSRNVRKGLVVTSFEELIHRG